MALDAEELELFNWAVSALPKWFTSDARQREELYGFAKMFGAVRAVVVYWFQQALITGALGPATGLPDWLNQHATDRGTRRQASETDEALRIRLRNTPDALTRASLLAAAQAIVDAEGIVGTVGMVELPRDGAHSGVYAAMTGTGGTFTAPSSGVQGFAPSTGWETPPLDSTGTGFPWTTGRSRPRARTRPATTTSPVSRSLRSTATRRSSRTPVVAPRRSPACVDGAQDHPPAVRRRRSRSRVLAARLPIGACASRRRHLHPAVRIDDRHRGGRTRNAAPEEGRWHRRQGRAAPEPVRNS
jgi:hypothetical protein